MAAAHEIVLPLPAEGHRTKFLLDRGVGGTAGLPLTAAIRASSRSDQVRTLSGRSFPSGRRQPMPEAVGKRVR